MQKKTESNEVKEKSGAEWRREVDQLLRVRLLEQIKVGASREQNDANKAATQSMAYPPTMGM